MFYNAACTGKFAIIFKRIYISRVFTSIFVAPIANPRDIRTFRFYILNKIEECRKDTWLTFQGVYVYHLSEIIYENIFMHVHASVLPGKNYEEIQLLQIIWTFRGNELV